MSASRERSQGSCLGSLSFLVAAKLRVGIVGGGIIGCASAFELARRGADVTVFDRRSPGGGATQASAGILAPYIEGHHGGPLLELGVRGLALYDDFVERVRAAPATPFEYRRSGTIEIPEDQDRADVLKAIAEGPVGSAGEMEWLDASRLRAAEPAISSAAFGGLLCRAHAHVAVMPFVSALVHAADRHGADFRTGISVSGISLESGRCLVETDGGPNVFDRIVLSAGSWSSLLDPLDEIRGAIRPIRGQLVVLAWPGQRLHRILWGSACYIVPWEDGTLLVGATSEDVGFDERVTVDGITGLLAAAGGLLRDVGTATFEGARVGLRPASHDGLPFIRPSNLDPRVFYAIGHFRNGVLLAPLTADLVANYLLEGQNGA